MRTQIDEDLKLHPSRSRPGGRFASCDGAVVTDRRLHGLYAKLRDADAKDWRPLYFSGEAGTGKKLMAGTAHRWGHKPGELRCVDCAEKPEQLEARLFGDPTTGTPGALEEADHGGLVLANVDYLPLPLQERLPEQKARLLLTSRAPLIAALRSGRLHPELAKAVLREYELPPLRLREHAVFELYCHFVDTMGPTGRPGWRRPTLDDAARELLAVRSWPGNVAELRSVVMMLLLEGKEGPVGPTELQVFTPDFFQRPGDIGSAPRPPRA